MALVRKTSALRAGFALSLASLVFALGLLVHLPAAHAWLHASHPEWVGGASGEKVAEQAPCPSSAPKQTNPEASCVITLFAQGLPVPVPPPAPLAPEALELPLPPPCPEAILFETSVYLHPPGQAPPESLARLVC